MKNDNDLLAMVIAIPVFISVIGIGGYSGGFWGALIAFTPGIIAMICVGNTVFRYLNNR